MRKLFVGCLRAATVKKTMKKTRLGILVSGGGSNLQAIVDATRTPLLDCAEVAVVISNKPDAFALKRAEKENIPGIVADPKQFAHRSDFYRKIIEILDEKQVDLVCLAGFLLKLEPNIVRRFQGRILNIHPALLPRFGGKGMYGHHVHEAVLKAGEKKSGCTVHLVDEEFDHGPTLLHRTVPVLPGDTPETLADRVLEQEHILYPEAIALYIQKQNLPGGK